VPIPPSGGVQGAIGDRAEEGPVVDPEGGVGPRRVGQRLGVERREDREQPREGRRCDGYREGGLTPIPHPRGEGGPHFTR